MMTNGCEVHSNFSVSNYPITFYRQNMQLHVYIFKNDKIKKEQYIFVTFNKVIILI